MEGVREEDALDRGMVERDESGLECWASSSMDCISMLEGGVWVFRRGKVKQFRLRKNKRTSREVRMTADKMPVMMTPMWGWDRAIVVSVWEVCAELVFVGCEGEKNGEYIRCKASVFGIFTVLIVCASCIFTI